MHHLLYKEGDEGANILSRMQLKTQQAVARWNEDGTNLIAHKMSEDFIWWLIQEADEGNWDGEKLTTS